jgi:hypothetical protein
MPARVSRFSLSAITALVACGCGVESSYNIPADESKDVAAIAATTPPQRKSAGKRKVTKPPGISLKDGRSVQPID